MLVATGIWLAQYYNPDPTAVRESVLYIQNIARLGDIIRGIHVWTAYLVVLTAVLHLIWIVVTASYKIPCEINWLIGLGLLALLLRMYQRIFNGPLDERWRDLADLSHFEMTTALPLLALLLVFGMYPALLLDLANGTVTALARMFGR